MRENRPAGGVFVGRGVELAGFRDALRGEPGAYRVAFVHGMGGIGKTALLERFAAEARADGRTVAGLSAPTRETLLRDGTPVVHTPGAVLLVDDVAPGLETWLRTDFLPGLAPGALVVVAGRRPPGPRWTLDLDWTTTLRVLRLGDLQPPEATALLRARNVPDEAHGEMLRAAGGHPLALCLAAAGDAGADRVLLESIVGDAPSPDHQTGLGVCAYVWRTTEDLLRLVCGDAAGPVFDWLGRQPYVGADRLGLFPHDVARRALRSGLRFPDPAAYEAMHRVVLRRLFQQARSVTGEGVGPAVRALHHMTRHTAQLHGAGTHAPAGGIRRDAMRPEDHAAVRRLAADAEVPVDHWISRQPDAFTVYRRDGAVIGAGAILRFTARSADDVAADPVLAAIWEQVRRAPLQPGGELVVDRFRLPEPARRPDGLGTLIQTTSLEPWVRAGGRTDWSFIVMESGDPGVPLARFGEHTLRGVVHTGERDAGLYGHDWREMPAETWVESISRRVLDSAGLAGATGWPTLHRRGFADAVKDLLRDARSPGALRGNPLLRSGTVAHRTGPGGDPAETLLVLLREAIDALAHPAQRRALLATYREHSVPQEKAAADAGMPFGTYRRHLRRAIAEVTEHLWREINH